VSDQSDQHSIAGISCEKYGGPEDASEMVYWSDITSDASFESPFRAKHDQGDGPMYMTFEPDRGGWDYIRMAMETVVVMAHAMGRTLVIPPGQGMYLLRKDKGKQNIHFSFADFFHLDSLDREHEGIDIITTEEFLLREAMTGHLVDKHTGIVSFPPENRTNWDGQDPKPLKEWLRNVTHTPLWKPESCLAVIPASADASDTDELHAMKDEILKDMPSPADYIGKPGPVDGSPIDRMKEILADRKGLCMYDEEMQAAPVIHFMCYHKMRVRLLVHFYAFLFFQDWRQDLWTKRFVRDHLRYLDELQCAAARIVQAIREKARKRDPEGNPEGLFDSFHIRRGDFQYKNTRLEADEIYKNSNDVLTENATVFIATDQGKKDFFNPLKAHYDVYFLDDFKHLLGGINTNYYGMIDQLIASKGRVFVGTYHSTFTGFINRMRGYYAEKHKLQGYEEGIIDSYYFAPIGQKFVMRDYVPVKQAFYAREFPASWRDIDKGVGELTSNN